MTAESSPSAAAPRPDMVWLVAMLVPFAVLAAHQWGWAPPAIAGDYAQYLLHAQAIVEGRAYAETGYIFQPDAWTIGPRAYPPGFPLTLAPIVAVAGVDSSLVRLLMLASVAAFAYLAWRRLSMDVAPWQAAMGAGFAALAIEARWGTLAPISDPGFAALLWGTVLAVDTTTKWTWWRILLVTSLGAAALAYRVTGLAVVGAFALYALLTWRRHRGRAAVPVVIWGAGGLLALAAGIVRLRDLAAMVTGVGSIVGHVRMLVTQYRHVPSEMALYPGTNSAVNFAWHATALLFIVVGLAVLARRAGRSFLAAMCAIYILMLLVSPVGDARYLWPLYPVGACALAVGLATLLDRVRRWWPSLPVTRVAAAVLGSVVLAALATEAGREPPTPLVGTADARELFDWLRTTNSATPMRIAFSNPRVVTLESGVPAMGNVRRTAPGHLLAYAERNITHLIAPRDDQSDCLQKIANTLPALYPDRFALAYENAGFRVYRVRPGVTGVTDSTFRRLTWREAYRC